MENTELNQTKVLTEFKPDRHYRNLTNGWNHNCAYFYKNGIMAIEHKEARTGKYKTDIDVYHFWKCNIPYFAHNENRILNRELVRIVIHEPKILLDGIKKMEVYFGNHSQTMDNMGITCNTLIITTLSGAIHKENIFDFISSDYSIQLVGDTFGGKLQSIDDVILQLKSEYANIEIH